MTGLKAQLNRKLHECGRDSLSLFLLGCVIAAALITFMVLSFLLGYILWQGLPNIETGLFALQYNSENVSLFPALVDTVLMVIMALAIATPLGIFAAVYLVEYASRGNRLVSLVRVTADTLAGIPSIVYGLFGMLFFVTYLKWGYSLLAGACTVAIMILPLIMRTTEEALKAIPDSYREGSYGLGAGKLRTVFAVVLPSAVPGILAGVILSIGRIVGETAALIYTAGTVAALPDGVLSSGRTLAVHMYVLASEGLYMKQAYATAVILVVIVVAINALSSRLAKQLMKGK
ncbi:phosphate ABC transporter permease PstA [uncultured Phascolarctobacterium sp.]|uniref:phosphate ABC transporter permease PstA n=1 Tax=uncultured Phascolarctobacterium sp. TaxID=512296 RepID=UPI002598358A|nr:phosphate ABC transporter permease PstA [uncultured Phascolarctobacterium sp.]